MQNYFFIIFKHGHIYMYCICIGICVYKTRKYIFCWLIEYFMSF